MKNDAADEHSSLVVRGIGGEKKSFKRFARGFVKKGIAPKVKRLVSNSNLTFYPVFRPMP
jgi:hypothetical protein